MTNKLILLGKYVLVLSIFYSLGCEEVINPCQIDDDKDGISNCVDTLCTKTPADVTVDHTGCRINIDSIHILIDNSGSMKGYMKSANKFKKSITKLLGKIDDKRNDLIKGAVNYYTTEERAGYFKKYEGEENQFTASFASGDLMNAHHSYLHISLDSLIRTVTQKGGNDIGIFITDGILSVGKERGSKDNQIKLSELERRVNQSFNRINENYGVSIYQDTSSFSGNYYYYDNTWKRFDRISRPYLMIVIGKKKVLSVFNETIFQSSLGNTVLHSIHWGVGKEKIRTELYNSAIAGIAYPAPIDTAIHDIKYDENGAKIVVGLQLNNFPAPMRTLDFLNQRVRLLPEKTGNLVRFLTRDDLAIGNYDNINFDDKFWVTYSHFALVELRHNPNSENLYFYLENELAGGRDGLRSKIPEWIVELSCIDDKTPDLVQDPTKVFGLGAFAEAIALSFEEQETAKYFECSFKLK